MSASFSSRQHKNTILVRVYGLEVRYVIGARTRSNVRVSLLLEPSSSGLVNTTSCLLLQSIIMIGAMLVMMHICVSVNRPDHCSGEIKR